MLLALPRVKLAYMTMLQTEMVIVREEYVEKKDKAHLTEMRQLEKKIKVMYTVEHNF